MDAGSEAEVRVGGAADVQMIWLEEDVGVSSGCAEQRGDFASGGHWEAGDGQIGGGGALE